MRDTNDIIIESNKSFLVAVKPAGQLSQKSERGDQSLQNQIEAYQKTPLHIITRLDRPVSGLVLFSKEHDFSSHFLKQQKSASVFKQYYVIVEGLMAEKEGMLEHHHFHDKNQKKARVQNQVGPSTKPIQLSYKVVKQLERYTILNIELKSGRFHQIRAQLSHVGYPVKGDVKYGARRGNKDRSIHLHSYSLTFKDFKGKSLTFVAPLDRSDSLWKLVPET